MENSDNQLRDKLNSNEFPFDPQAWAGMEAMLDEKKKRRGFFWWWTGGIAAALLCGVIGFELHDFVRNKTPGTELLSVQNQSKQTADSNGQAIAKNTNGKASINEQAVKGIDNEQKNTAAEQIKNSRYQTTDVNDYTVTTNPAALPGTKNKGQNGAVDNAERNGGMQPHEKQLAIETAVKSTGEKNSGFAGFSTSGRGAGTAKQVSQRKAGFTNTSEVAAMQARGEVRGMNAVTQDKTAEEKIILNRLEAELLVAQITNTVSEKMGVGEGDDVLPKQKQKIFAYSLGVAANITGTTLGRQPANPKVEGRNGLFYNSVSYMAGLTHDFTFVNRVAITNSILYSQTSFDVLKPKSENYPVMLTYYTSKISELAIPVGLKVYPVVKRNFKMYISAGIINHIKLKETFDYSIHTDTLSVANLGGLPDQFFPTENSFDQATKSHDVLAGVANTPATTDDFSLNRSKRYYTSFYAGAGVEYIAKNHFILFCEPMFYMSLQKIGVQDKRKYNFGGTGGFRYRF